MAHETLASAAARLSSRIDALARFTDERGCTTRTFLSPAMRRANAQVARWMRQSGLSVREDGVGNLIGRAEAGHPGKTLILGSHLDTVRDAGRFDGILGVLLPLAALDVLRSRGVKLGVAVEVVGFSEEEGVRFSSAYLGSKGYTGSLTKRDLALRDADGVSVADALRGLGSKSAAPTLPAHRRGEIAGYLEVHIEQGPVLESRGLAAGVVGAIAGQTRARIRFTGKAGHAGTTPMALRRDAVAGAAEFIGAVEAYARTRPPLVATVGKFSVKPGAANVIGALAELSLDVRHPVDAKRLAALAALSAAGKKAAARRGLAFEMEVLQDNAAVRCDPRLTRELERSVERVQGRSLTLTSGAGHDAVVVSRIAPVSMLFVRCRDGLSHHPDEHVSARDLATALAVVVDFLTGFGSEDRP
jgi:allantoate deiminase